MGLPRNLQRPPLKPWLKPQLLKGVPRAYHFHLLTGLSLVMRLNNLTQELTADLPGQSRYSPPLASSVWVSHQCTACNLKALILVMMFSLRYGSGPSLCQIDLCHPQTCCAFHNNRALSPVQSCSCICTRNRLLTLKISSASEHFINFHIS